MDKARVIESLHELRDAREKWDAGRRKFNSAYSALLTRLMHEAVINYMSPDEIGSHLGVTVTNVRAKMRTIGLNPKSNRRVLTAAASQALTENAAIMGIEPGDMDLTSPLAYLPMGEQMRKQYKDRTTSQVHEVSGNAVTPEMIDAFRQAWREADARGEEGHRVEAGLKAALAVQP